MDTAKVLQFFASVSIMVNANAQFIGALPPTPAQFKAPTAICSVPPSGSNRRYLPIKNSYSSGDVIGVICLNGFNMKRSTCNSGRWVPEIQTCSPVQQTAFGVPPSLTGLGLVGGITQSREYYYEYCE
uniref:uncharacterized protein LOC120339265 n=1 Tax=Styela clava TaxID=7725 RepID=UPI00193A086B|nr:uncharacterized protein LOC120339265 [Styela clava]